ncbi:MAG: ABC transporter substrate-binding protein [Hyphomicrobiales bacterium]|nr:ABC transporter substrate-binding protein [Hyphomicrobiales bacterium]
MHHAARLTHLLCHKRLRERARVRFGRCLLAVLIVLIAAGVGAAPAAFAQPIHLRYGQAYSAQRSIFALPLLLAERKGFFLREGLDFHMVPVPGGGTRMIDALHDGTADISHVATPFLVQAVLKGSDAVAVVTEFNNPIYSLVAKPEIRSYADLKGKLIGLAAETGSITISIRRLLAMNGISREDFRSRFVDGTPDRLVCLTKGDCDAVPLGQPQDFVAMRQGFRLLGLSTEAVPDFVYTVTAARASWAKDNREALIRYVRALGAAFAFLRDPANREDVIATIADTTGFATANARLTLSLYFEPERHVLPMRGEIGLKGMATAIGFLGETGVIKPPLPPPERFVDLQYLRAAGLQD